MSAKNEIVSNVECDLSRGLSEDWLENQKIKISTGQKTVMLKLGDSSEWGYPMWVKIKDPVKFAIEILEIHHQICNGNKNEL